MIFYTLDNNHKNIKKSVFIYAGAVVFCVAFGFIYEFFSHGIISYFTLLGFLVPLVLGLIPYLIMFLVKIKKSPNEFAAYIYNAGVATLTVGSYFKGMLDIYGTTRDIFVIIYAVVGAVLVLSGLIIYLISLNKK